MSDLDSICISWHIDDVIDRSNELETALTRDQARVVLINAVRDHDANIGINWEVIDTHIDLYFAKLKSKN